MLYNITSSRLNERRERQNAQALREIRLVNGRGGKTGYRGFQPTAGSTDLIFLSTATVDTILSQHAKSIRRELNPSLAVFPLRPPEPSEKPLAWQKLKLQKNGTSGRS